MRFPILSTLLAILGFIAAPAIAQPMTFAEVQGTGAQALSADEAKALISGAKVELTLVNGSLRIWTNAIDGKFAASRNIGAFERRSAQGTWSVEADGTYCLAFDWGSQDKDNWCRLVYKVEDRYYSFAKGAKPDTRSGVYRFSR